MFVSSHLIAINLLLVQYFILKLFGAGFEESSFEAPKLPEPAISSSISDPFKPNHFGSSESPSFNPIPLTASGSDSSLTSNLKTSARDRLKNIFNSFSSSTSPKQSLFQRLISKQPEPNYNPDGVISLSKQLRKLGLNSRVQPITGETTTAGKNPDLPKLPLSPANPDLLAQDVLYRNPVTAEREFYPKAFGPSPESARALKTLASSPLMTEIPPQTDGNPLSNPIASLFLSNKKVMDVELYSPLHVSDTAQTPAKDAFKNFVRGRNILNRDSNIIFKLENDDKFTPVQDFGPSTSGFKILNPRVPGVAPNSMDDLALINRKVGKVALNEVQDLWQIARSRGKVQTTKPSRSLDDNDVSLLQSMDPQNLKASDLNKLDFESQNAIHYRLGQEVWEENLARKLLSKDLPGAEAISATNKLVGEMMTPDSGLQLTRDAAHLLKIPFTVSGLPDMARKTVSVADQNRRVNELINNPDLKNVIQPAQRLVSIYDRPGNDHPAQVFEAFTNVHPTGKSTVAFKANQVNGEFVQTSLSHPNPNQPVYEFKPPSSSTPEGQQPQRLGNIMSAGNSGTSLGTRMKALAEPDRTIIVGAIRMDGLTPYPKTNQPRSVSTLTPEQILKLQSRFIVAPGSIREVEGTSIAAPRVSGAVSKLLDFYPRLDVVDAQNLILDNADPILIDREGRPYDLKNVPASKVVQYLKSNRIPLDDLLRGREVYGMGRLNVQRAMEAAGRKSQMFNNIGQIVADYFARLKKNK